jgi:hypothetical protein
MFTSDQTFVCSFGISSDMMSFDTTINTPPWLLLLSFGGHSNEHSCVSPGESKGNEHSCVNPGESKAILSPKREIYKPDSKAPKYRVLNFNFQSI